MLGKYSDILSAGDPELAYFFRIDINKQHRNNETGTKLQHFYKILCLCMVFATTSKV